MNDIIQTLEVTLQNFVANPLLLFPTAAILVAAVVGGVESLLETAAEGVERVCTWAAGEARSGETALTPLIDDRRADLRIASAPHGEPRPLPWVGFTVAAALTYLTTFVVIALGAMAQFLSILLYLSNAPIDEYPAFLTSGLLTLARAAMMVAAATAYAGVISECVGLMPFRAFHRLPRWGRWTWAIVSVVQLLSIIVMEAIMFVSVPVIQSVGVGPVERPLIIALAISGAAAASAAILGACFIPLAAGAVYFLVLHVARWFLRFVRIGMLAFGMLTRLTGELLALFFARFPRLRGTRSAPFQRIHSDSMSPFSTETINLEESNVPKPTVDIIEIGRIQAAEPILNEARQIGATRAIRSAAKVHTDNVPLKVLPPVRSLSPMSREIGESTRHTADQDDRSMEWKLDELSRQFVQQSFDTDMTNATAFAPIGPGVAPEMIKQFFSETERQLPGMKAIGIITEPEILPITQKLHSEGLLITTVRVPDGSKIRHSGRALAGLADLHYQDPNAPALPDILEKLSASPLVEMRTDSLPVARRGRGGAVINNAVDQGKQLVRELCPKTNEIGYMLVIAPIGRQVSLWDRLGRRHENEREEFAYLMQHELESMRPLVKPLFLFANGAPLPHKHSPLYVQVAFLTPIATLGGTRVEDMIRETVPLTD